MDKIRCVNCGYLGQSYYKKKINKYRCGKCGAEFDRVEEVKENGD